jgi:3-(3-hydroxy-phenyl)propionate hydroxylase
MIAHFGLTERDLAQKQASYLPVLIVGGGPTGLLTALTLAANGVRSRVIDRRAAPAGASRALGCQPRSMEVLAALGVAGEIVQRSKPLGGSAVLRGDTELFRIDWVPPDAPYPYTYIFPQTALEDVLRARLGQLGVTVEWNLELVGFDDHYTARLADGQRVGADWIVGSDGARSRVREAANIAFEGRSTGEVHYLADVSFRQKDPVSGPAMWLAPEGPLMLMPLPGDASMWRIFVDVTGESEQLPEPTHESLQALMDERALGPGRATIDTVYWTSTYRTSLRLAHSYRRDRVFLAGDAAHVFPPYGGQGMNTGIQDAFNLGWKLARVVQGKSSPALLDTYESERRPVAVETIRQVDQRRRLFAVRNPLGRALRDVTLRAFMRSERVRRAGSYATSELGITYHGRSWACVDDGPVPRPRAGDRAPDGPVGKSRLFEIFRPTRFTLLAFGEGNRAPTIPSEISPDVTVVEINATSDPDRVLTKRYDAEGGALVLVRPDGHIGFRGRANSLAGVESFLSRLRAIQPDRLK